MAPSSRQKDVMMVDASSLCKAKNNTVIKKKPVMVKKKKIVIKDVDAAAARARRRWRYYDPQHISKLREDIVGCLRDCQVLIVVADSYSDRSPGLPRYLGDPRIAAGPGKKIACAFFSANAAMMAARCPPADLGLAGSVTMKSRRNFAPLDFLSVGLLLQRMAEGDRDLSSCSAVYVDAAHHRTLPTDVLLASLLPLLVRRSPGAVGPGEVLRLVLGVTPSAAHEAEKLSAFFGPHCITKTCVLPSSPLEAPVISYVDPGGISGVARFTISAALELHRSEETYGSILLYTFGGSVGILEMVCRLVQKMIEGSSNPKDKTLHVIPLHSGDDWEVRGSLPEPPGRCLFVLSPEAPDASPRLHGVSYVIDPGVGRRGGRISQQSANECAAHLRSADPRWGPPKCLRLYPERAYRDEMPRTTTPEILTCGSRELSDALVKLKALGVTDPWTFNFIDRPPNETLALAIELMAPLPEFSTLSLG